MTPPPPESRLTLLYGGTFDPPHAGHAALPLLAAEALHAHTLLYLPAGRSPFKLDHTQSPPHHRLAMLELMVAQLQPRTAVQLRIDPLEIHRGDDQPTYTIDTVRALHQQLGPDVPLRLLLGTDQFFAFTQWKDAPALAQLAPPVVMTRPPHGPEHVDAFLRDHAPPYLRDLAQRLDLPALNLASRQLRDDIAHRRDVTGQLSPDVLRYAKHHHLYDDPAS